MQASLPPTIDPAIAAGAAQRAVVLLADNAGDAGAAIAVWLECVGVHCIRVNDGAEAVATVCRMPCGACHAIVMALDLPVLDGRRTAPVLRAIGFGGPLIALTAQAVDTATAARDRSAGFSASVCTAVELAVLQRSLSSALGAVLAGAVADAAVDRAPTPSILASRPGSPASPPALPLLPLLPLPSLPHSDTGFEDLPAFASFRRSFRAVAQSDPLLRGTCRAIANLVRFSVFGQRNARENAGNTKAGNAHDANDEQ